MDSIATKPRSRRTRKIGAECSHNRLSMADGRSHEAKLMKAVRKELIQHVGGSPSATQRALIDRAVNLTVRLHIMDRKFAETGGQTDHDSRTYLAWSNSLTRTMRELGAKARPAPARTLADILNTPQAAA